MSEAIEIVKFRPKTGVNAEELESAALNVTEILESMDGYISRDFAKAEDGNYIDVVRWQDLSCAKSAAENVMKEPLCGAFFELIDEASMQMEHYVKL